MAQNNTWSAGQVLAQAEGSIGTTVRTAVANYYKGHDLDTAQAIRRADTTRRRRAPATPPRSRHSTG